MNKQQLFNTVATHLIQQGKPSAIITTSKLGEKDVTCLYRAPDGCRCAVGCLIDDEVYTTEIEYLNVRDESVRACLQASDIDCSEHLGLLACLQAVHDQVALDPDRYADLITPLLKTCAKDFSLKWEIML